MSESLFPATFEVARLRVFENDPSEGPRRELGSVVLRSDHTVRAEGEDWLAERVVRPCPWGDRDVEPAEGVDYLLALSDELNRGRMLSAELELSTS